MKFLKQLVNRIKAGQPIPIKAKQAMVKTIQRGKSLPASIKSALVSRAIARKAVPAASMVRRAVPAASMVRKAVPTAMVRKAVPTAMVRKAVPTAMVRRAVPTAMVRRAVPSAMVRRAVPKKGGFFSNIKKLVQVTNPSVVKAVNPVQRSFMPVDLPYETMSNKQTAMRIPATNFAMPTNIDLIQPPVDGGTSNYYGK
jgi:hypothetical protein